MWPTTSTSEELPMTLYIFAYLFLAVATFIATYDTHSPNFSPRVKMIGTLIISLGWPMFITSKLIQKLLV